MSPLSNMITLIAYCWYRISKWLYSVLLTSYAVSLRNHGSNAKSNIEICWNCSKNRMCSSWSSNLWIIPLLYLTSTFVLYNSPTCLWCNFIHECKPAVRSSCADWILFWHFNTENYGCVRETELQVESDERKSVWETVVD